MIIFRSKKTLLLPSVAHYILGQHNYIFLPVRKYKELSLGVLSLWIIENHISKYHFPDLLYKVFDHH